MYITLFITSGICLFNCIHPFVFSYFIYPDAVPLLNIYGLLHLNIKFKSY
jgi:hypothetical protein